VFTGIIENIGIIKKIDSKKNLMVFSIDLGVLAKNVHMGDSVAVSGVCLTVSAKKGRVAAFDLMKETIERTALGFLSAGDQVNLELALQAGSRMGGHFVTGHVDEMAVIKDIAQDKNWVALRIGISKINHKFIAPKASVTIDGISLTIGKVGRDYFEVYLIPYTLKVTTLGLRKAGDCVNIETDILAKYLLNKE